jgi:hypothetical protein
MIPLSWVNNYFFLLLIFLYVLSCCTNVLGIKPNHYTANFRVSLTYNGNVDITPTEENGLLDENTSLRIYSASYSGYSQQWTAIVGTSSLNVLDKSFDKSKDYILTNHSTLDNLPRLSFRTKQAENINDIQTLRTSICREHYSDKDALADSFSTLVFFLCSTEMIEVKHIGKFFHEQITLSRGRNINFATQEVFSDNNITVKFIVQQKKHDRKKLSEHAISTPHPKLIYPNSFISGELLDMHWEFDHYVDIAANILTPPSSLLYLPSSFRFFDKVILIPSKPGKIESHCVRRFQFSFRFDDASYSAEPFLDSLSVEIFSSGRFIGQVNTLNFQVYLSNLGITGSGYIDINYERIFNTQEERREVLKRPATTVVDISEAERKKARLSRFQINSTEPASCGNLRPMYTVPFSSHALNKAFQGTVLSCLPENGVSR